MKEKLKSAIKGNPFIVWLRILFDKIGESFSLTLYSGSTNQTKDIFKKQAELQIRIHALERVCLLEQLKSVLERKRLLLS